MVTIPAESNIPVQVFTIPAAAVIPVPMVTTWLTRKDGTKQVMMVEKEIHDAFAGFRLEAV